MRSLARSAAADSRLQTGPPPILVDLHQQHKQMVRDFVFRLVELLQPCTDGLLHYAVQRCGLIRCPFAIGRMRHADTVIVPPVPSTECAKKRESASRKLHVDPAASIGRKSEPLQCETKRKTPCWSDGDALGTAVRTGIGRAIIRQHPLEQAAAFHQLVQRRAQLPARFAAESCGLGFGSAQRRECRFASHRRPVFIGANTRGRGGKYRPLGLFVHLVAVVFDPVLVGWRRRRRGAGAPDILHERDALLAQDALHAADRVALAVEQMAHAAKEIDVFGPIETPAAAALHRADLREAAFPEAQHVLRHIDLVSDFADGAESPRRLVQSLPLARAERCRLRGRVVARIGIDALLENRRRLEHHDTARGNRHLLAGLRITPDPLSLLAHHERAERRQLYGIAALQTVGNFFQYKFYERRRLAARQTDPLVDRLAQIGTCYRLSRHGQPRQVGDRSSAKTEIALYYQRYELGKTGSTGLRTVPEAPRRSIRQTRILTLPADQGRAPGEAATHGLEQKEIAAFDPALVDRVGQRQRDG